MADPVGDSADTISTDKTDCLDREISNEQDIGENLEKVHSLRSINNKIPDKFSGWGLLSIIGCFFFNFNTWGSNAGYALYLQKYINDDVFPHTNKIDYGTIGGLTFGSGLLFGPLINFIVGYLGVRNTIIVGSFIQFIGVMLASFSTQLWELYCTQGILQGIGMAFIAVPMVIIVPQWFKGGPGGKRNLAAGIQSAGCGVGGILYNIGMEPIMNKRGWQWALRTQAILCIILNLLATLLVRTRNKNIKPIYKIYDKDVFHTFGNFVMMLWEILTLLGYVTLMYNLGDFTRSMGYNNRQGSIVSTMVAVGAIYGRPIVGKVADIFGPIQTTIVVSWIASVFSFAMWLPCKNFVTAVFFALIEGSLIGTIWMTMATITAAVTGLQKFGVAMSLSWIAIGSSGLVSPIIGIALKSGGEPSRTQYRNPAIFVGCCFFGAGLSLCILRGWLIERNRLAKACRTENERLMIKVPFKDIIKGMARWGDKV